jgi:hypothetical protein
MSRFARHTDSNHRSIVNALRAMGCTVEPIQGATGTPDLLVGVFGLTELVEVKPDVGETRRRNPRESQVEWAARWRGRKPVVVRTLDDCAALVSRLRGQLTRNEVHTEKA